MAGQLDTAVRARVRRAVACLAEDITVERALVFGSQVEGRAHRWSDIDVAVFSPEADDIGLRQYLDMMLRVGKTVGYDLEVHLYPTRELDPRHMSPWSRHVLQTGVQVYG